MRPDNPRLHDITAKAESRVDRLTDRGFHEDDLDQIRIKASARINELNIDACPGIGDTP